MYIRKRIHRNQVLNFQENKWLNVLKFSYVRDNKSRIR